MMLSLEPVVSSSYRVHPMDLDIEINKFSCMDY